MSLTRYCYLFLIECGVFFLGFLTCALLCKGRE